MKFSKAQLFFLNFSGAIYTVLTISGVAFLNLYFTCPDLSDDCYWPGVYAFVILLQISVNLFLFHYYLKRNQVQFWTAKSSWLFDRQNLEKKTDKALNGPFVEDDSFMIKTELKRSDQQQTKNNRTHSIGNFENFAICENGTYVDLRSELHGTWTDRNSDSEGNAQRAKYCYECKMVLHSLSQNFSLQMMHCFAFLVTPRRCQHCPLCNICVLRKDHHCFLLGGCAGLANQRYFIVFLFWSSIGAIYGSSYNFSYLNKHVAPWFPTGWLFYLGPVAILRWVFGYESLFNALLCVFFSVSVASSFGAIGFFVFQMIYTLSGYTMFDFHRSGHRRGESDGDNFQERLGLVFGRRWWINFMFPQFWVPNQMNEKIAKNIFLSTSKDL